MKSASQNSWLGVAERHDEHGNAGQHDDHARNVDDPMDLAGMNEAFTRLQDPLDIPHLRHLEMS
jgi:hypothetical protein